MFDVIFDSGEQKSIFRSICVNFKTIFHVNLKKLPYQGGTPRLRKSFPCAENFFFSLTDDIFVICNLKITKNNINTYHNMHCDKKLPKKKHLVYISGFIPRCYMILPCYLHKIYIICIIYRL